MFYIFEALNSEYLFDILNADSFKQRVYHDNRQKSLSAETVISAITAEMRRYGFCGIRSTFKSCRQIVGAKKDTWNGADEECFLVESKALAFEVTITLTCDRWGQNLFKMQFKKEVKK